ncbi:MAG: alkaline phosphatase family protein [Candidatus Methylomirabilis oxyfera]|nr:alkaline phosphatase family protein [Candidatus Methylomirabilis oxyfera]
MVVDGLPQEQVVKYYDLLGEGGLKRLLDQGAWFNNANYSHATTYTAVGHATLLSCAHPYKHGIIGNDWMDKKTKQRIYSTEDQRHTYLGEETKKHQGTSPFNLKVTTVGDELIYANGKSKVIAISGKDRSAIGLGGHAGTAYMHSTSTGRFITSDYYMKEYPEWWEKFYAGKPQDRYFGKVWTPLLPDDAYARSAPDDRPWSKNYKGLGTKFPHPTSGGADKPSGAYYDAMIWTPYGDELTLDFVKAAIEGENLGKNPAGVPDLLAISWTTHDYVQHLFGPESKQSQDHLLRLDRVLADFFRYLDSWVGLENVVITLSADHGFMNIPEYSASRNLDAGRIDPEKMIEAVNASLSKRFGDGRYVTTWWNPTLFLDYDLIDGKSLNRTDVENAAAQFLIEYPGIAFVYTRTQLEKGKLPETRIATQVTLAWHQQYSGDIVLINKPNWYLFEKPFAYASTHGAPYAYDTNVPLMLLGSKWVGPGKYGDAEVVDLGRTLAFLLNVRPPNGCEGRVLTEILR